jgi:hypothetical protein
MDNPNSATSGESDLTALNDRISHQPVTTTVDVSPAVGRSSGEQVQAGSETAEVEREMSSREAEAPGESSTQRAASEGVE